MTKFLLLALNANLLFVSILDVKNANANRHTASHQKNSKTATKGRHSFTLRKQHRTFHADPARAYGFPNMIHRMVAGKELLSIEISDFNLLSPVQRLKYLIDHHPGRLEQQVYEKGFFQNTISTTFESGGPNTTKLTTTLPEGVLVLEATPHRLELLRVLFQSHTMVNDYQSFKNPPIPWVTDKIRSFELDSEDTNDGSLNILLSNVKPQ